MHSRSDTSEKFAQLAIINNHSVLFLAMLHVTLEFHFPFFLGGFLWVLQFPPLIKLTATI
jgi:hypothetical protein